MREIEIDIDEIQSRQDVDDILRLSRAAKGDHLKLLRSSNVTPIQVFSILFFAFLYFLAQQKKRADFGKNILDKVFGGCKNEKELEDEIEKEYGIKVTVEPKSDLEREDWMRFSAMQFEKRYTEADDIYDSLPLKEPNPKYVPWKKEM